MNNVNVTEPISTVREQGVELEEVVISPSATEQTTLTIAFDHFSSLFSDCLTIREKLEIIDKASHFPKKNLAVNVQLKDRLRLCYLTTFQSNSLKSPFTADQIKVFKKSSFQSRLTVCCLAFAIFPFIFISSASYSDLNLNF